MNYKSMIEAAREYCKRQHDRWDKSIALYKGIISDFRKQKKKDWVHMIEVNVTRPTIDAMLPNIIFKTPKIMVRPAREIADQNESTIALGIENDMNAMLLELDIAREYKAATRDALILGVGFVKHGLTTDIGYDKDNYTFPAPFSVRTSPWETWVDPASRDPRLADAGYVCFRTIVPLERAKKAPELTNTSKLQATMVLDTLPQHVKEQRNERSSSIEYTQLIELWDREKNKLIVLDDAGVIYRKDDWPYDLKGNFPLSIISFNQVPEEFYCMGEPEFLYYLQLEASEKRTQQLNHTRRFNRKYQVPNDTSDDDVNSLREGEDGTVIRSNGTVTPIADAPLSQDVYQEIGMIMTEVKEVTGISAYQRGGSESGVYSATAAKIIDANANIRVEERRDEVAKSIAHGARVLYNVMRETKGWPEMEFNITVDVSTMQRPDDEGKRNQLIQFGQIGGQMPEFKRANWLRDLSVTFHKPPEQYAMTDEEIQQAQANQPPDPEAQKAQMEMQLLQQKAQMDMQKAQMDLQMKQQEAQIELQKAQMEMELKRQEMEMKLQLEREKLDLEREKMSLEAEKARFQQENMVREGQIKAQLSEHEMSLKAKAAEQNAEIARQSGEMKLKQSDEMHRQKVKQARGKKNAKL